MARKSRQPRVAYFCMEFGLHEDFRIYSGGLGILAGDILKAARDEKMPIIGVGILWRQGYVKQVVGDDGKLYDCFAEQDYDFLKDTKKSVTIFIRGRALKLRVWKCTHFGNVPLYLLDANLAENADRLITGQLYGWFSEERIAQEMILGIGGVRALEALHLQPDIYHFNDCHPVFAGLELIRTGMDSKGMPFEAAWEATRRKVVFTTHTPVMAGNEFHDHELLRYMGATNGLSHGQMLRLGGDPFSMTAAGLRLARKANAVAKLHAKTAQRMWQDVKGAADIIAITNGVHRPTWQDRRIRAALEQGKGLWEAHMDLKRELIEEVRLRNGIELDEDVLLIGFGRRSTAYKRAMLIFKDKAKIDALLRDGHLQLVFSGKAHPNDLGGKALIERLLKICRRYRSQVVYLEDYDMKIGRLLTRGCDVWLNNPVRPMEASGTSGMKAAMNGVLNLSVLDGWWPEGCRHGVNGWQIGGGYEGPDADRVDSASLYKVLNREVIPAYYRNRSKWLRMMKASIKMSSERFSAGRMLDDYYRLLYS